MILVEERPQVEVKVTIGLILRQTNLRGLQGLEERREEKLSP